LEPPIDIIYNISTIVVAAIVFISGFKNSAENQIDLALTLLIIGGVLLRFNVILDPFLHAWDERYHVLVAQNTFGNWLKPTLYKNPAVSYDYTSWVGNHVWIHKQPFPIWMMAVFSWISPTTEWVYRLPSLIFSTLGIWYTYKIGNLLFNHKTGYLAAFLFAIHGLILEMTGGRVATDHFDLYFLVLVTMSVWFGIKPNGNKLLSLTLSGVFLGCAILTKWLPALIVFPILCIHWFPKISIKELLLRCIVVGTIAIIISVPWQLFIWHHYPLEAAWEHTFNAKHVTEALEGQGGPFYYHFDKMRMLFGDLIYLPILWLIYLIFSKNQKIELLSPYVLLLVWILIPFLFFSFVETKMQGYTLFTAPAIFITTSCFFFFLRGEIIPKLSGVQKRLILAVAFLLIGLPIRYSLERIKPLESHLTEPEWAREVKSLKYYSDKFPDAIFLNVDHYIEAMVYTRCSVYEGYLDEHKFKELLQSESPIFVIDDGRLPNYLSHGKVQKIHFPLHQELN